MSEAININSEKKTTRRPPGRPRINPLRSPVERRGVSSTPKKDDNAIELIYSEPMMFKKALQLFKAMSANEMTIVFDKTEIRISASNNTKKSDVLVTFDCSKMVHYYCEQKSSAVLNVLNVEKVNQVLNKNHTMVTMVLKKTSFRSSIIFIFQNDMRIDEVREVMLIVPTQENITNLADFNTDEHPIKFQMTCKFFKKFIVNSKTFAETLTFRKVGAAGNLTFSYTTDDNMIKSQHIVKDNDAINLESTIDGDDVFIVSIKLDYIKPLANALITPDIIQINAHNSKKMVFIGSLDDGSIIMKIACNTDQLYGV
jgi:hypothetical protein